MTTFEDRIELEGTMPNCTFNIIRRDSNKWELTVNGVKDVETGEIETKIMFITDIECAFTLALCIDFKEDIFQDLKKCMNMVLENTYKDLPDYLRIIP